MITDTANLTTWNELLSAVELNDNVLRIPMATLRHLEGRQRVGKHILSAIEEKLESIGLGHLPEELPNRQQQYVVLYREDSPVARLIDAVRFGTAEPVSEETYLDMHQFNSTPDPETVVSREEVGEAIEQTAHSVLELLGQIRPGNSPVPVSHAGRMDLTELVQGLDPTYRRKANHN